MEQFIQSVADFVVAFRELSVKVLGPAIPFFEVAAVILSGILVWGIVYTIAKSGWLNKKIEVWMDTIGAGDVGRRRQIRAWQQILKRMKTSELSNWKLAILEADRIMDEILKSAGYRKDTVDERFKQLTAAELSNAEQLVEAHRTRNRVAQEPDFTLTHKEAIEVLRVYKKSFQEFGLLD